MNKTYDEKLNTDVAERRATHRPTRLAWELSPTPTCLTLLGLAYSDGQCASPFLLFIYMMMMMIL